MVYTDKKHLVADSINELHLFASGIGLDIKWYQMHRIPHYDIWGSKIKMAIKAGAIVASTRELIKIIRPKIREEEEMMDKLVAKVEDINNNLNDFSLKIKEASKGYYEIELYDDEGNSLALVKEGASLQIDAFLDGVLYAIIELT